MSVGLNLEIKYGSPQHAKILSALRSRRNMSAEKMRNRHTSWKKADEQAVAYIKEKDADAIKKSKKTNQGIAD